MGLGFAIPIVRAERIADDLRRHGAVRHPWIGVKLQLPTEANLREALTAGAIVRSVVPASPAAEAGIQPGDRLLRAGARPLRNPYDWEAALLSLRVGDRIPITVQREGRETVVQVAIADLPEVSAPRVQVLRELELVTLTPAIRAERGVRTAKGALVFRVSSRVAEELGLQRGDVVVQINRAPVESADDAARALDYYSGRGPIRMFFEHAGRIYATDFMIQ